MAWKIEDNYDGEYRRVCTVKADEAEFRIEYGLERREFDSETWVCSAVVTRYEPTYRQIAAVTTTGSSRAEALRRARRYAWSILAPELP